MSSLQLLLGKSWPRRRDALPAEVFGGLDAAQHPVVSFVCASARRRRALVQEHQSAWQGRAFVPEVFVFSELLATLWLHHGDGRALLPPATHTLMAEHHVLQHPWLAALGPSTVVASALAQLHTQLLEHGLGPPRGAPWVQAPHASATAALDAALRGLHQATHGAAHRLLLAEAIALLPPRLARPEPALQSWLRRPHAVVVDVLPQPSPLRTEVLLALCEAWRASGTHVVLTLESGHGLGGGEAGLFLDYDAQEDGLAYALKPFESTRPLRRALFRRWVAHGAARISVASAQGVVGVEPHLAYHEPEERSLADHLYTPVPIPLDAVQASAVRYSAYDDGSAELVAMARWAKSLLLAGVPPHHIALAHASLSQVETHLRAVFADHGVPVQLPGGSPVIRQPWVGAFRQQAFGTLISADEPDADWLIAQWHTLLKEAIPGGPPQREALLAQAAIARLLGSIEPPQEPEAIPRWIAHLDAALATLRIRADIGGIEVLEPEALDAGLPPHTWLGGLERGAFPTPPANSWLVHPTTQRTLSGPSPLSVARGRLCSLLRTADDCTRCEQLVLSHALLRQGRHCPPAPLLLDVVGHAVQRGSELVPLHTVLQAPACGSGLLSRSEQLRWAARAEAPVVAVQGGQPTLLQRQRSLREAAGFGLPGAPEVLSVTAFELYRRCPARFWYSRVLGLEAPEPESPELAPAERGSALHRILEAFTQAMGFKPLPPATEPDPVARTLARIAGEVLDAVEAEQAGQFHPVVQAHQRERWLGGLVQPGPAGILRAWLDAERASQHIPVAVEERFSSLRIGPIRLRGSLDRLDRLPGGDLVITDYKTGTAPTSRAVREGTVFQPLAYVAAVASGRDTRRVAHAYLSLRDPAQLQRTGWAGHPELLDQVCAPAARRHALELGPHSLRESLDRAAEQARALVSGAFPTTRSSPRDAGCAHCDFARICRQRSATLHDEPAPIEELRA